uniref:Uncharacterized protein n=1 Tax=Strongyloides papillosus TaxID=174720 RepID=A0A0N5BT76_STREA
MYNFSFFKDTINFNDPKNPMDYKTWVSNSNKKTTELIISTVYPFLSNNESTIQINNVNDSI